MCGWTKKTDGTFVFLGLYREPVCGPKPGDIVFEESTHTKNVVLPDGTLSPTGRFEIVPCMGTLSMRFRVPLNRGRTVTIKT